MEFRHLRYFIAVAEELSFTRAAQRLGMEQPPLSQQIRHLENEIGTQLFQRLPRGVALTDAGQAFFGEASEILARIEHATAQAQRIGSGHAGRIRLGMINSAPFHPYVPRLIREFGQQYAKVALTLQEASTPALAAAVRGKQVDAAFVRPLLRDDEELLIEPLFDEAMVIALPEGHALTRQPIIPLRALAEERFVLFSRAIGSGLYNEIISACQRAHFIPRIVHEVLHVTSIANLVAADLGISIVPDSMRKVHSDGVVYRPIEGDAPIARMSLVYRRHDAPATVHNLLRLAAQLKRNMAL